MQNMVWKIILILVVVGLCLWSLSYKKIRLGKDLQGGTSLIYLVNIPDDVPDKQALLQQTIDVLKERVNPRGVLDISMHPLGVDRIEIVMPLPKEEVLNLRREYEAALNTLATRAEIDESKLDEALRFNRAVEEFGGGESSELGNRIALLQQAYNRLQDARQGLAEAKTRAVEGDELNRLEQAVADAQFEYEDLRQQVLQTSLDRARVIRILSLSTAREPLKDENEKLLKDERGNVITAESPREAALAQLNTEFRHLTDLIDQTVAAYDTYQSKRTTLDDPEDLIRLLRGAGVLDFHIAVREAQAAGVNIQDLREQLVEVGPENTDSAVARWFPINDLKQWYDTPQQRQALEADPASYFSNRGLVGAEYQGQHYLLLYTTQAKSMTHRPGSPWTVEAAGTTVDQLGRTAVSFQLDQAGGQLMSRLTGAHVNEQMAIVLDGQAYSAPVLRSQIGRNGVIEGEFSPQDIDYLIRVLAAGALEARLGEEPIAINTLGPSLGRDNLHRGLTACVLSIIVTAVIMLGYYFFAGFVANVALMINALMIFGVMSFIDGTFTLPGLAGIALSIAMAVDANVLIYERIREELVKNKENLRNAIRLGYQRALNAIVDGNLTNLIVCVVLLYTATTEVKGFALTMMLGVGATLFTALFVTRVLYAFYTESFKFRSLPMLPIAFPAIHRALEPKINWIAKRGVFLVVSLVTSVASLVLVASRGVEMLDTEFRGGLSMTMKTRPARSGEPASEDGRILLSRPEVEAEIRRIGEEAGPDNPSVYQLRIASVLTMGEMTPDFRASAFQIKVASPPGIQDEKTITDEVVDAIFSRFSDRLEATPSLSFTGAGDQDHSKYTFPIEEDILGLNMGRPQYAESVSRYRGGVAVVIDNIAPPVTIEDVLSRIVRLREQPDFARTRGRETKVIGLEAADPADPGRGYTSLVVIAFDRHLQYHRVDFDLWESQLAVPEWKVVSTALSQRTQMHEVNSFSPAVARSLAAAAVVAITLSLLGMLVYIWVRFGSLRYSVCTVIALTYNVIICLGALALTHILVGTQFASLIQLDEYRIDLNVIAALLTIIGYSLNDTIVILDRIRENRGKRLFATPEIVNTSINQTFSRTVLTGGSTVLASIILFSLGGTGIQPFAFTFLIGLLVGTYSSVAIAAPLVCGWSDQPASPAGLTVSSQRESAGTVAEPAP